MILSTIDEYSVFEHGYFNGLCLALWCVYFIRETA